MRRVSWRLIPLLMLLYLVAYIDRSNISVAALQMNGDLGLSAQMYGLGAGLFYVTYIIFEVPSNLALARFGARRWIARIMITWGLIAALMSTIQTPTHLYIVRLLLGAAEAGFTPGIIYYLSQWYPRPERARAMSAFYIGATLASVIGLPLSGALLHMDGLLGHAGWRWLFLVEGIPAIVLGFVVLRILPDRPETAAWLPADECRWLRQTLDSEQAEQTSTLSGHGTHQKAAGAHQPHGPAVKAAFGSGTVWALALFWLLQAFGTIGLTLFLPLLMKQVSNQGSFVVGLLAALPFLFACLTMYLNGRHSDRTGERAKHLGLPLLAAGLLLIASVYAGNLWLSYAFLVLSVGLNWASTPVFWAVTTERVGGLVGAAAIALINAVANIAGLGLPPIMGRIRDATGTYQAALVMVAVALVIGGLLGLKLAPQRRQAHDAAGVKARGAESS
jgi:MFS family permease